MTDEIKFEKKLGNASASDAAAKSSMLRFFQKKKLAVGVAARGAVSNVYLLAGKDSDSSEEWYAWRRRSYAKNPQDTTRRR